MEEKRNSEVEKGFDDDELKDIMSEIESLEADAEPEVASHEPGTKDLGLGHEPEAHRDPEPEAYNDPEPESKTEVISMNKHKPKTVASTESFPSSMNFKVGGEMNWDLWFDVAGEKVHLYTADNDEFVIELSTGARFTLPLKKAA